MLNTVFPRVYAGDILSQLEIKEAPIDVYKICNIFNIELIYDEFNACDGGFLLNTGRKKTVINSKTQVESRRRFTIAHELGHYLLPNHKGHAYNCKVNDATLCLNSLQEEEKEANSFASELLMPTKLLYPFIKNNDISLDFRSIIKTAKYFNVSIIAAALRLLTIFNDEEETILIYSNDGKIIWCYYLCEHYFEFNNYQIPSYSLTNETLHNKKDSSVYKNILPSNVWFYNYDNISIQEEVYCYKKSPIRLTLLKILVPIEIEYLY